MLNPAAIKTISDLRQNPLAILKDAKKLNEPIYLFYRSKPQGVIMDLKRYEELIELLQDYQDTWEIKQRLESETEWIPWEKVKKELNLK